jgi:hypothetical protein
MHDVHVDVDAAPRAEGGAWGTTPPPRPRGTRWPSGQGSSDEVAIHVAARVGENRGSLVAVGLRGEEAIAPPEEERGGDENFLARRRRRYPRAEPEALTLTLRVVIPSPSPSPGPGPHPNPNPKPSPSPSPNPSPNQAASDDALPERSRQYAI